MPAYFGISRHWDVERADDDGLADAESFGPIYSSASFRLGALGGNSVTNSDLTSYQ